MVTKDETFTDRLIEAIQRKSSVLCVGLDPQLRYMPLYLRQRAVALYGRTGKAIEWLFVEFFRQIIDAVEQYAIAVKPQLAFFEQYGVGGIAALEILFAYAESLGLLRINDAKRGDGGDTADAYADGHIGEVAFFGMVDELTRIPGPIRADAVTVQPWIGEATFAPFLKAMKENGTGVFVVTKTSFKPNSVIEQAQAVGNRPMWENLAELVRELGKGTEGRHGYCNFGAVLGATYPEDAPRMRAMLPTSWMLIPGYGRQGGGADDAVLSINEDGFGGVVNSARAVTYAYLDKQFRNPGDDDWADRHFADSAALAANTAKYELNEALKRQGKKTF